MPYIYRRRTYTWDIHGIYRYIPTIYLIGVPDEGDPVEYFRPLFSAESSGRFVRFINFKLESLSCRKKVEKCDHESDPVTPGE
jgi:hypothetical protein